MSAKCRSHRASRGKIALNFSSRISTVISTLAHSQWYISIYYNSLAIYLPDSKSCSERSAGSSPAWGTILASLKGYPLACLLRTLSLGGHQISRLEIDHHPPSQRRRY